MEHLREAKHHARESDSLPEKSVSYSGTFVKAANYEPFGISKNYTETESELIKEKLSERIFDFMRNDGEFIEFQNSF